MPILKNRQQALYHSTLPLYLQTTSIVIENIVAIYYKDDTYVPTVTGAIHHKDDSLRGAVYVKQCVYCLVMYIVYGTVYSVGVSS